MIGRKFKWTKFPKRTPTAPGYYYTYYYNERLGHHLYKAHFWNGCVWTWKDPMVVKFWVEETRSNWYTTCLQKSEDLGIGQYNDWFFSRPLRKVKKVMKTSIAMIKNMIQKNA